MKWFFSAVLFLLILVVLSIRIPLVFAANGDVTGSCAGFCLETTDSNHDRACRNAADFSFLPSCPAAFDFKASTPPAGTSCKAGQVYCSNPTRVEPSVSPPFTPAPPAPTPTRGDCEFAQAICYEGSVNGTAQVGVACGTVSTYHFSPSATDSTKTASCFPDDYSATHQKGICCSPNEASPTATPAPPPAPCQKDTSGNCVSVDTGLGSIPISVTAAIATVFGILLSLSGGTVLIIIILSGYRLMTSQGDPEKIKGARESLTAAIIGLLFVIFSITILRVIGVDILHIPGLTTF